MTTTTKQMEYNRTWRAKNKEKVAAQMRRYRRKHPETVKKHRETYLRKKYGNK